MKKANQSCTTLRELAMHAIDIACILYIPGIYVDSTDKMKNISESCSQAKNQRNDNSVYHKLQKPQRSDNYVYTTLENRTPHNLCI